MKSTQELKAALGRYQEEHPTEAELVSRYFALIDSSPNCFVRSCFPAHITVSALVISPTKDKLLLLLHRKLKKWLQPGGHLESANILTELEREIEEETSLTNVAISGDTIFDLDIHAIPARTDEPTHEHYDIRFLAVSHSEEIKANNESDAVRWFSFEDLETINTDGSVLRMAKRFQALNSLPLPIELNQNTIP